MKLNFLESKRNIYLFAMLSILVESFSSVSMKSAGKYPIFSINWFFFYGLALFILMVYSVMWQLLLEKLPLSTAYLRKGVSYILIFVWAFVFFGEAISIGQIIGAVVIMIGMVVSQLGEN